jgi:hypothetical protein
MAWQAWTPTSIAGCATWLDASNASSMVLSGSNVTQWKDLSGAGNNFSTTSAAYPTYGPAYGLGTVTFPSSAIMTSALSTTVTTSSSVFVIVQVTAMTPFSNGTADGGWDYIFACPSLNGGDCSMRINTASGELWGSAPTTGSVADLGNNAYFVNGTNATTTTMPPSAYTSLALVEASALSLTGSTAFTLSSAVDLRYLVGNICEVVVYTAALTTTQRQLVEGMLAIKWGLQPLLPASHPYSVQNYTACFLAGTRIRAPPPMSERIIEELRAGDLVETSDGRVVPVRRTLRREVRIDGDPWMLEPCVLRQGVLGATRDLFLSPRHGVWVDGRMEAVANVKAAERSGMRGWIAYHHLQLPHPTDDLVANGVRCESYREDT